MNLRLIFKWLPTVIEAGEFLDDVLDSEKSIQHRTLAALDLIAVIADETDTQVDDEILAQVRSIVDRQEFWSTLDAVLDVFFGDDNDIKVQLAGAHEAQFDPATISLFVQLGWYVLQLIRERRKNRGK
jgi:hypothetical protein